MSTGKPVINIEPAILKIVTLVYTDMRISEDAKSQINSLLSTLGIKISEEAAFIANTSFSDKDKNNEPLYLPITETTIKSAVEIIMDTELSRHAVDWAKYKMEKYKPSLESQRTIIPVAPIEKLIRLNHCGKITEKAILFLAASLEYICMEVTESAASSDRSWKKRSIDIRDLFLAIYNDPDLSALVRDIGWKVVGGGELPHIDSSLLTKTKKPKKKSPSRKASSRKSPSRKASSRKSPSRKASSRKSPSRKASSRKASSRKTPSRKASSRKSPSRKASSSEFRSY